MDPVKKIVKPRGGHIIQSRGKEIVVGLVFFLIGAVLLWDAFDGRGIKMPWPMGAVAPW